MKQEENDSNSLFDEKTAPPASDSAPESAVSSAGKTAKFAIIAVLVLVVGAVLMMKKGGSDSGNAVAGNVEQNAGAAQTNVQSESLPRFIELGSKTCIPCKMMAPILDDLRKEYPNSLQVEFVDIKEDPDSARLYGVRVMPTQVFLDAEGVEIFRHEGFFPKDEILAQWKELGIDLQAAKK